MNDRKALSIKGRNWKNCSLLFEHKKVLWKHADVFKGFVYCFALHSVYHLHNKIMIRKCLSLIKSALKPSQLTSLEIFQVIGIAEAFSKLRKCRYHASGNWVHKNLISHHKDSSPHQAQQRGRSNWMSWVWVESAREKLNGKHFCSENGVQEAETS